MKLVKDLGMLYPTETSKEKKRFGLYECICGKQFKAVVQNVKRGKTKGCGCLRESHGLWNHKLYIVWNNMIQRCTNPKRKEYKDYGARGIYVCDRWLDINNFIEDMYPSFEEGLSIDRKDNNKGYSKENCRWTTQAVQSRNTRKLQTNNTIGFRNVCKYGKRYVARICINNKKHHIGYYNTAEEAAKAYDKYIIDNKLEHTMNFE